MSDTANKSESATEALAAESVTKMHLIEAVADQVGVTKKEATELVELFFETLKSTLAKGKKIKLSGFGNFVVREKKPRLGRNPQTGESMMISARRVLTFRPSPVLRDLVNPKSDT
jgi:integration host factor subunit alpha